MAHVKICYYWKLFNKFDTLPSAREYLFSLLSLQTTQKNLLSPLYVVAMCYKTYPFVFTN
jgi:hypothetical protein